MSKLLVVVGATGGQGSSVIQEVLKKGTFDKIRGITRNVSSEKAQHLTSLGVEMVAADLNDEESLVRAFHGATAIFAITDYYETFRSTNMWIAMDVEYLHGLNLAKAAARTESLEHYVWSTLPSAHKISNKKMFVGHFEAKARVDEFIKSRPALFKKTTFLWLGFFIVNFLRPTFAPVYSKVLNKYMLLLPTPSTALFAMLSDHTVNIGLFVRAILAQPARSLPGKYVFGNVETVSLAEYAKRWGAAVGKTIDFVQVTVEDYCKLFPGYGAEMQSMIHFWAEYGEQAWSGEDMITADDLGITDELVGLEQAWKKTDWNWIA